LEPVLEEDGTSVRCLLQQYIDVEFAPAFHHFEGVAATYPDGVTDKNFLLDLLWRGLFPEQSEHVGGATNTSC
jgi:hypothetical protein